MRAGIFLLFASLLCLDVLDTASAVTTWPSDNGNHVETPDLMYLAYYYPWYIQDDWSRHALPAGDEPLLGYYGTNSTSIAKQHIEWALLEGGISSWVVSWWGDSGLASEHFQKGMLPALDAQYEENNNNKADTADDNDVMKFCLIYESKQLDRDPDMNFDDGSAQAKLVEDFQAIKEDYFDHPSYLRVGEDERPVIVMYITRWITNTFGENFNREVLDLIRESVGEDIYFIADEPFFNEQHLTPEASYNGLLVQESGTPDTPPITTSVFDAYTTYNMYEADRVVPGETAAEYMLREAMPIFEAWAGNPNTRFFPNVLPMYHDFRPGHGPLGGNPIDFRRQLDTVACLFNENRDTEISIGRGEGGLRSSQTLPLQETSVQRNYSMSDVPDMIFVTSFNEWWEGSQVEPDRDGRYDLSFLQVLKDFKNYVQKYGYHWC
ncbi:MAG: hypothetical protein SGILL_006140 [Bacillariaceae sp.]